jgi:formylglycine-generating enzyme required for sulfatase activity
MTLSGFGFDDLHGNVLELCTDSFRKRNINYDITLI